jgi:hypothetical protein
MPIGYLVTTALMAAVALSAVSRHRPRRSSPFRLSYVFGFVLNWPLVAFVLLVTSTALAVAQSGVGSPVFWIGLGFAVLASAGLVVLRKRAQGTSPALERALDEGLGAGWRDGVDDDLAVRLGRRPSLARILFAPISFRRHGVKRIANIRYGPARRGTCSTSIAIAPIVRSAQRSSTSTQEPSASAASVWEHVTCSIGSPARAGCASAQTTGCFRGVWPIR